MLLAAACLVVNTIHAERAPGDLLRCEVRALPGRQAAVEFELTLVNRGRDAVHVLEWGTPFEGAWLQPFVEVWYEGSPLAYRGAMVKRGDPSRAEYFTVPPGQSRHARIGLQDAFDLSGPGAYRVLPKIVLHDVVVASAPWPRPTGQHRRVALECPAVGFSR